MTDFVAHYGDDQAHDKTVIRETKLTVICVPFAANHLNATCSSDGTRDGIWIDVLKHIVWCRANVEQLGV